jgi:transposase
MELYAAIDLHSNNSVLAVIDEARAVVFERRLPNDLALILDALAPFRDRLQGVAVESTYNWYWLVDGLQDAGVRVHLVNTAAVQQYSGLKHGDDHSDARWLAQLLQLGVLPEGFICPRETRAARDLLRRRMLLVHQGVQLMLSMESMLARRTGRTASVNVVRALDAATIVATFPDPTERFTFLLQLRQWSALRRQTAQIEAWLRDGLVPADALRDLRTIPGIGEILGTTIVLETGPIERFASVGDYASYCRMVESVRLSNGKRKGRGNAKCGNRHLCWAFIEAANFAIRHSPPINAWYQRKRAKAHRVVALKAVAHKLARAAFHILRDHSTFDVHRAFG